MTSALLDAGLSSLGRLDTYTTDSPAVSNDNIFAAEGHSISRRTRRSATKEY